LNDPMAEDETGRKAEVEEGSTVWRGRNWLRSDPRRWGARKGASVTRRMKEKRARVQTIQDLDSARFEVGQKQTMDYSS
jgi:hypothetical protein